MFQILICSSKLNSEKSIQMKLQNWVKTGLQLVLLSEEGQILQLLADNTDLSKALWIVEDQREFEIGKKNGIAVLPYVDNLEKYNFTLFPTAETVLAGLEDVDLNYLDRMYRREKGIPWTIVETDEYLIRELAMSDMDALFELYEDETLYPFVEPLFEREKEEEYELQYISNMYHLLGYGMWLVFDKETGLLIGRAGVESHEEGLELGYLLRKEYRGRGLAERICRSILAYVKSELDYKQIRCMIHEDNYASICLAEKLGFKCEKSIKNAEKSMVCYTKSLTDAN